MINRIITKIFSIIEDVKYRSYYKTCQKRGLKLGKNVILRNGINFGSEPFLIEIGDNTKIGSGVTFTNHDGGTFVLKQMEKYKDARRFERVKIGSNCLIAPNSTVMLGAEVGDYSILGYGSILTTSIPSHSVFAGSPAKFICTIEEYGEKRVANKTEYPRELEADRPALDQHLIKNLPYTYKAVKK
jgi:acetyltransferase-like isoleucine patch superfamily enzyme